MTPPLPGLSLARRRAMASRAILRAALLALLLGTLVPFVPVPDAHAIGPADYRQLVADALALAEQAAGAEGAARDSALAAVGRTLDAAGTVELGDGRAVAVANPPLRTALDDRDAPAVRAHLAALLAALDGALAAPAPPPDARARLAAVLASAEFRPPEQGWFNRLVEPLVAPFRLAWQRFLRALLSRFEWPLGGEGDVALLVLGALVVLGVGALLAGAFAGNVVSHAQAAMPHPTARPGAAATRARALALAEARQHRAAIHELYLATLLHLDERGLLRFRPSLTNREHLAPGRASPTLAPLLAPLVEAYDRLWYGGVPCTTDDWQEIAALADAAWRAPSASAPDARPLAEAP